MTMERKNGKWSKNQQRRQRQDEMKKKKRERKANTVEICVEEEKTFKFIKFE